MRKLFVLFAGLVAIMTFSASNCSKRDPIILAGSKNNPTVVGLPVGKININVRLFTSAGQDVPGAEVNIALSRDSITKKMYLYPTRTTNDSGRTSYDNLQLNKIYWFNAKYKEPASGGNLSAPDSAFKANTVQLPTNAVLVVN